MEKYFTSADILLPDFTKTEGETWAVIACDQFTSEPEYWEAVDAAVGDAPSTLRLILPEVYLQQDRAARISSINAAMPAYERELLLLHQDSMIYLERTDAQGKLRRGLVGKIDLEDYDYTKNSTSLIRATEATVLDRIPPRLEIRRDAAIELPHVMLLLDDPENALFSCCEAHKEEYTCAYDFPLMLGGGHVRGYFLHAAAKAQVAELLEKKADALYQKSAYPMLFAVGDGNHSLATAKAHYETVKRTLGAEAASKHPARYALAELVNLHDASLEFEPIYRTAEGVAPAQLLADLKTYLRDAQADEENAAFLPVHFTCHFGEQTEELSADHGTHPLAVGTLQAFLDLYQAMHPELKMDYIHGEASLRRLAQKPNTVGFLFSGMTKEALFPAVEAGGSLPRKTFSMGEARDKRYYIESRKIR